MTFTQAFQCQIGSLLKEKECSTCVEYLIMSVWLLFTFCNLNSEFHGQCLYLSNNLFACMVVFVNSSKSLSCVYACWNKSYSPISRIYTGHTEYCETIPFPYKCIAGQQIWSYDDLQRRLNKMFYLEQTGYELIIAKQKLNISASRILCSLCVIISGCWVFFIRGSYFLFALAILFASSGHDQSCW